LHGLEVASSSDGHPEDWFTADGQKGRNGARTIFDYPNSQPPTTLWYHDHTLGLTRLNVYAGLAGMYLIRDPNDKIEHPAGAQVLPDAAHEMPLVIQDKSFNDDGSLRYSATFAPAFFGDANVVNGKVWPQLEVERTKYRFRILNASNHRFYRFGLSNGQKLTVIGSDGGYLRAATDETALTMGPGERADVLIDFSNVTSAAPVVLTNSVGRTGTGTPEAQMAEVVRFVVPAGAPQQPALAELPPQLNTIPALTADPGIPRRTVTLNASGLQNLLDGQSFHSPVSELPRVGSTEEWDIVNLTGNLHSIHLHLIQFQIVGRQGISAAYNTEWNRLNGAMPLQQPTQRLAVEPFLSAPNFEPPLRPEAGWKDTVQVPANGVTRIRVRWAPQENTESPQPGVNPFPFDPTNPADPGYIWHCHLLEHEDHDMMRPIRVEN
jgi:FtsP/CotA-like multicopper oxidase with cupredoxin domain